jgi:hypothetical protein
MVFRLIGTDYQEITKKNLLSCVENVILVITSA